MIPFDKDCTTPKASELIRLYAEYVEGYMESSMVKYNQLIKTATMKDILYVIYHTPFERHSVKLASCFNTELFPIEVLDKIKSDNEYVNKMDRLMNK